MSAPTNAAAKEEPVGGHVRGSVHKKKLNNWLPLSCLRLATSSLSLSPRSPFAILLPIVLDPSIWCTLKKRFYMFLMYF